MFNDRGRPVDPTGDSSCRHSQPPCDGKHNVARSYKEFTNEEYEQYLERIVQGIRSHSDTEGEKDASSGGTRRLLIFIHGGMNSQKGALERVVKLHDKVAKETGYYPVFVNWRSSLTTSYFDHLLHVRQGEWKSGLKGGWLLPLYATADLVRAVGRAPVTWYFQLRNLFSSSTTNQLSNQNRTEFLYQRSRCDYVWCATQRCTEPPIPISRGDDTRGPGEKTLYSLKWGLTSPIKAVVSPAIDALGTGAWDVMYRRTNNLFHPDSELIPMRGSKKPKTGREVDYQQGTGGLSRFLATVERAAKEDRERGKEWEIELVGHSMGAIILNEIVRKFGDKLPIRRIAYLAAACSLNDYQNTIFPYLEENVEVMMHHVTLHDRAEARDNPAFDLAPRGSLLVWIDNYLSKPRTPMERTAGSFANLVLTLNYTPVAIRDRITVKALGVGKKVAKTDPQGHGDFDDDSKFFSQDFWLPTPPGEDEAKNDACKEHR